MNYRQVVDEVATATNGLPLWAKDSHVFGILLEYALYSNEGPSSDDTRCADRTETDPATTE